MKFWPPSEDHHCWEATWVTLLTTLVNKSMNEATRANEESWSRMGFLSHVMKPHGHKTEQLSTDGFLVVYDAFWSHMGLHLILWIVSYWMKSFRLTGCCLELLSELP